jgi:hypothetical protein
MAEISKEFEIEVNGRTVNVNVTVEGYFEADYGADADGNRGVGMWFLDGHSYEADEELTGEEKTQVDEKVEELVNDEAWDFEAASQEADADEDDEEFF